MTNLKRSLMTWINELLEDEKMFPSAINVPFPAQFRDNAFKIIKRLFRVYAHIYLHHLQVRIAKITLFCLKIEN